MIPEYNPTNNTVTIPEGYGYWDLRFFPWGGDFHRMAETTTLPVEWKQVNKAGAPLRLVAISPNGRIGIQF